MKISMLVLILCVLLSSAAAQPDIPSQHWAYDAVKQLVERGILKGYPDGLFRGSHPLSRYELAHSLRELLRTTNLELQHLAQQLRTPSAPAPPPPLEFTREEKAKLHNLPENLEERLKRLEEAIPLLNQLIQELTNDLRLIGEDVQRLQEELETTRRQTESLQNLLHQRPKLRGRVDLVARGTHNIGSRSAIDLNGYTASGGLFSNGLTTHELELQIGALLPSDIRAESTVVVGNYMTYLQSASQFALGTTRLPGSTDFTLWRASLNLPVSIIGRQGTLQAGRVEVRMTPFTLWRPDVDFYVNQPRYDRGYYALDGVVFTLNTDLLSFQVHAGKHDSTGSNALADFMRISAGNDALNLFQPGNPLRQRPNRIAYGIIPIRQSSGAMGTIRLGRYLQVGAQILSLDAAQTVQTVFGLVDRVNVWGWTLLAELDELWQIAMLYAQSDLLQGNQNQLNRDNWAFVAQLKRRLTGATTVWLDYRELRPYFAAPGSWGRIGYWYNPTDLMGVQAGIETQKGRLGLELRGTFLRGTGKAFAPSGFGKDDRVDHWWLRVRWQASGRGQAYITYEGVFWNLRDSRRFAPSAGLSSPGRPREHYLTLELQHALTPDTVLRGLYQVISYDADGVASFSLLGTNREQAGVVVMQLSTTF